MLASPARRGKAGSTSLGLALVLLGAAVRIETAGSTIKLELLPVVAFQLLTAPIAGHMVGEAAHRTGHTAHFQVDELADLNRRASGSAGRRAFSIGDNARSENLLLFK